MKGIPSWPVGKGLGVCSKGVLKQPLNPGWSLRSKLSPWVFLVAVRGCIRVPCHINHRKMQGVLLLMRDVSPFHLGSA